MDSLCAFKIHCPYLLIGWNRGQGVLNQSAIYWLSHVEYLDREKLRSHECDFVISKLSTYVGKAIFIDAIKRIIT